MLQQYGCILNEPIVLKIKYLDYVLKCLIRIKYFNYAY